jgi:hypothetical protein
MHAGTVCETEPGSPPRPADPGFRWTVLQRHGRRPLAVLGRVLLRADNRCAGLPCWSEITVHETAGLRFAASLCHSRPGTAGPAWCDAWLCDSPEAVRGILLAHDPLGALPTDGMPASYAAALREAAAMQRFRGAWSGLLAALFGLAAPRRRVT